MELCSLLYTNQCWNQPVRNYNKLETLSFIELRGSIEQNLKQSINSVDYYQTGI
jgi:hypothetical protein